MNHFTSNESIHQIPEYGGKNMYFLIKDEGVQEKYGQIWDVIKNNLKIRFHNWPVYDKKYLKTKVKEYDGAIKTIFLGNDVPKKICIILALLALQLILL